MKILEFFNKYKYLEIQRANSWNDIDESMKTLERHLYKKLNAKKSRYESPLGNKNLITLNCHEKYFISMSENHELKGMASLTIKDIYNEGKLTKVAYLSDLKVSHDFCLSGKRQWRNAFVDIILNKDNIDELRDCEFFYGLIDVESEQTKNLFKRFEKIIDVNYIHNYTIHNIFSNQTDGTHKMKGHQVRLTTLDDREKIIKFSLTQIAGLNWCDSPESYTQDLRNYIANKQSLYIEKNGEIQAHICFMRTRIDKLDLMELNSKFNMAKTVLPFLDSGISGQKDNEKINSIYIPVFHLNSSLNPIQRIEVTKILIQTLMKLPHQQKESVITVSNIYDRAVETALESFICMSKYMQIVSFKKKEVLLSQTEAEIEKINDIELKQAI